MTATLPIPALLPTYAPYPFPLVRGEGDRVFDDQGQAWWDFYGGHCVCATGHSHPTVVKAVAAQAASLLFYSAAAACPCVTAPRNRSPPSRGWIRSSSATAGPRPMRTP